ncbi:hypothetical protein [Escherichia coli]|uniref:hypothetical protein n=1 Tax=Escherichia coli TaxID=562 RepID=UPI000CFE1103|nr:hypothetical protein [Escherichia coli]
MSTFTDKEMIKEIKERIGSLDVRDNIERRAYEIALESMEAEPVAWTDDEELRDVEQIGLGYLLPCPPDKYADPRRVIPLYRVPPAPTVQAQGIEIAINELVSLSPQLDKRAVETLSMAVAHLRKLVKKQLQVKE